MFCALRLIPTRLRNRMNQIGAISKLNSAAGYDQDDSDFDEWEEDEWDEMMEIQSPGAEGPLGSKHR